MGRIGFFPSKYVLKLAAGEKVLQVTHNIQIADSERGDNIALLRDQIVIQVSVKSLLCTGERLFFIIWCHVLVDTSILSRTNDL